MLVAAAGASTGAIKMPALAVAHGCVHQLQPVACWQRLMLPVLWRGKYAVGKWQMADAWLVLSAPLMMRGNMAQTWFPPAMWRVFGCCSTGGSVDWWWRQRRQQVDQLLR